MKIPSIKIKKTYLKIFLTLSVIFTVIIMIFSIFLSSQFSEYALSEIDSYNQNKLLQTVDNFEFVLNKIRSTGMVMYEDPDIHNWLFSDNMDNLTIGAAVNRLTKMLPTEPFIYKAILVNTRLKLVLDSNLGTSTFDTFSDKEFLNTVINNRPEYVKCINYKTGDKTYFELIIPSTPSKQNSFGYLVLLIDKDILKNYLFQSRLENTTNVVILDSEGQLLLGSVDEKIAAELNTAAKKEDLGKFMLKNHNDYYSINYASVSTQDWKIYFITPVKELMLSANAFKYKILTFCIILLIIQFSVILWNTRRIYKPYENLADQIQSILKTKNRAVNPGSTSGTEYSVIKNGIEMLTSSVDELKNSIQEHKELIKSDYLKQWINFGRMNKPIKEYINKYTNLQNFDNLTLIVLRIEAYLNFSNENDFLSRNLLKYGICNIVNELIGENGWAVETVDMGSDYLVSLVSSEEFEFNKLISTLDNVSLQVSNWLHVKIAIATSEKLNMDDDLKYISEHIYELTMLKFIWGKDKVYVEKDFDEYLSMVQPVRDEVTLEELIQAIRLGHSQKIAPLLDKYMQGMLTMTYSECKFQLTLGVYSLFKAFNKLTSIDGMDGIQGLIDKFDTLQDVRDWIERELLNISDNLANKKGSKRKDEIVMEIVEYVKNHLQNPLLSVEDVAEHVSLSAGYVRQIFKDTYGITFSDYILDERITVVKRLLESTEWSVTDIAERSGFQTKSYFFTAFKKAFGMSPAQYRYNYNTSSKAEES